LKHLRTPYLSLHNLFFLYRLGFPRNQATFLFSGLRMVLCLMSDEEETPWAMRLVFPASLTAWLFWTAVPFSPLVGSVPCSLFLDMWTRNHFFLAAPQFSRLPPTPFVTMLQRPVPPPAQASGKETRTQNGTCCTPTPLPSSPCRDIFSGSLMYAACAPSHRFFSPGRGFFLSVDLPSVAGP